MIRRPSATHARIAYGLSLAFQVFTRARCEDGARHASLPAVRRGILIVAVALMGLGSCSLVVDPDVDSIGSPPQTCAPGEIGTCACLGGLTGKQLCNDGGYFNPCQCGTAGAGG